MPLPDPILKGNRREYLVGHLIEMTPIDPTIPGERRLLSLVLPTFQRPEVWSAAQKSKFIESIFLGLGAGYYVTNGADYHPDGKPKFASGWLLDGQQRISSIRDFISGTLTIFGDVNYMSLSPSEARSRFLRASFPVFELDYCGDERVLRDLYDRLNFGGTPHAPSERATPRSAATAPNDSLYLR